MPQATGSALVQSIQRAADAQHAVNQAARQVAAEVKGPAPAEPPPPPAPETPAQPEPVK